IRPDAPGMSASNATANAAATNQVAAIQWMKTLGEALAEAMKSQRAVMVVVLASDKAELTKEQLSAQQLVLTNNPTIAEAVRQANFLAVRTSSRDLFSLRDMSTNDLPMVAFLAPDWSRMTKGQPKDIETYIWLINQASIFLSQWRNQQKTIADSYFDRPCFGGRPYLQ
ncbi:MAG: hypothetical protein HY343_06510, partial [Lentisphaerae bacterium]|nr:hypothetical protein [Lentisphaerota bacterium]